MSLEATDKSYYESFTDVGEFYRTLSPGSYKLRADAISDGGYEGFADVEAVFKTVPEPNILFLFGSLVLGLVGFSFRKN